MRILLSNDDGIHARGLEALRLALSDFAEVTVVAPDRERSASGHGITVDRPIRVAKYEFSGPSTPGWVVDGTPTDCVKLAVCSILAEPRIWSSPESTGREPGHGCHVFGHRGGSHRSNNTRRALNCHFLKQFRISGGLYLCGQDSPHSLPGNCGSRYTSRAMLNVNVLSVPESEIRGIKLTKLGIRRYEDVFSERKDPRARVIGWPGYCRR